MNVALVNLTSGGLSGGYTKYLAALLPRLAGDRRIARLHVFVHPSVAECNELPLPVRSWPAGDGLRGYRGLRAHVLALAPDVVFFPTARLIPIGQAATVVMVRNMEPLTVPLAGNTWSEGLRNLARARAARAACRRATRVIAVSEHVKAFLTRRWKLPEARIGVVHHGVDPAAAGPAPKRPPALHGSAPFLFVAGSIRPARGLEDAIGALPRVLERFPDLALAIAGGTDASGRPYAARMRTLSRALGVERRVLWVGHLAPAEMAWAFSHCRAFVVTSRAEACPNLALEAMSHGAPIVSTAQPPMPEFFESTAVYYAPGRPEDLAARLTERLTTPEDASRADTVRRRVAAFTWQRTADRTIEELQRAVETAP